MQTGEFSMPYLPTLVMCRLELYRATLMVHWRTALEHHIFTLLVFLTHTRTCITTIQCRWLYLKLKVTTVLIKIMILRNLLVLGSLWPDRYLFKAVHFFFTKCVIPKFIQVYSNQYFLFRTNYLLTMGLLLKIIGSWDWHHIYIWHVVLKTVVNIVAICP